MMIFKQATQQMIIVINYMNNKKKSLDNFLVSILIFFVLIAAPVINFNMDLNVEFKMTFLMANYFYEIIAITVLKKRNLLLALVAFECSWRNLWNACIFTLFEVMT